MTATAKKQLSAINTAIAAALTGQMSNLEQAETPVLSPGSIKGAMKAANDGEAGKSRDLWQVPPQKLRVVPDLNPRVETPAYQEHIRDLADSMLEHGFFQDKPLAGYVANADGEDVIYIIEGGSRLKAVLLAIEEGAQISVVPVSVDQKGLNVEDILVRMVRGNTGRPLSQYEAAIVCKRLARFSWDTSKIALSLGMHPQQVENSLLLMGADERIRQLVGAEVLSFTFAVEMIKEFGAKAYEQIEKAQQKANAAGKTRITKRHVTGAAFKKELTKAADPMYHLLASIKQDASFASLSAEIQEQLLALLTPLQEKKAADAQAEPATDEQGAQPAALKAA
jgi:ParB family chromosome partitioning protein